MSDVTRVQLIPKGVSTELAVGGVKEEAKSGPTVNKNVHSAGVTVRDGKVEIQGHSLKRHNSTDTPSALPFTAQSLAGQVLTDVREIGPSTRFYLNGMELGIDGAVAAGLIVKKADGSGYALPGEKLPTAEAPKQEDELPGKMSECFPREIHEFAQQMDGRVLGGSKTTDNIANRAIEGAASGDLRSAAAEFAQRSPGLEPAEAQALLEEAIERSVSGVASFITKYHGVDGKAVIAWATEALPPREKADIARRIYFGERRAIAQLTAAYERAQFLKECSERKAGA